MNYTTGITLNVAELNLVEGDTAQLYPDVQPSNAWNRTVTWTSSNAGVVSVSDGALTAVAVGSAIITASTFDGNTASATVNVAKAVPPKKVLMNAPKKITMGVEEVLALSVTMQPDNARSALTWTSSKPAVATVDASGAVTAVKKGSTTITAKAANGKKAKVKITVVDPYEVKKIAFDLPKTVTVSLNETLTLTPSLTPATARTTLQWSSSKSGVASVNEDGVVTGLAIGSTSITVRTANGKKAKVKVKVVDPNVPDSLALTTATGETTFHVGQTVQLIPVLSPSTASAAYTWTSSKGAVASVSGEGILTALSKGSTSVTVQAGKLKAKLKIRIVD